MTNYFSAALFKIKDLIEFLHHRIRYNRIAPLLVYQFNLFKHQSFLPITYIHFYRLCILNL